VFDKDRDRQRAKRCEETQGGWPDVVDDRVPVDRMPIGYRVPGFLRFEITLRREGLTAQSETDGLRSTSDESTV
jgi:hypothetical protein